MSVGQFSIVGAVLSTTNQEHKGTKFDYNEHLFKGCGMGPWLVLVSSCLRENVVATCKIGSFLV